MRLTEILHHLSTCHSTLSLGVRGYKLCISKSKVIEVVQDFFHPPQLVAFHCHVHLQQTLCGGTLRTFAEELWLTCTTQRKGGTVLNALHRFAQQILSVCHMSNHFHTFPSHVGVSENGVHPKNMMCLIGK